VSKKTGVTTKSFSLPERLFVDAKKKQEEFGYESFSEYIVALIRQDLELRTKAHFTILKEEVIRRGESRDREIEQIRAELQWQTDPSKLQALSSRLSHYGTHQPQSYEMNETKPKKKKINTEEN
jgi:hypothetical protein